MKPAIGYIRVSTAGQLDGVSLEAQEAQIRAWAQMHGREVLVIEHDDGVSGCLLRNRPGAQAAIRLACEHRAPLVAYSLSRLFRSTKEALQVSEQLQKHGADIVSLSEQIDTTSAVGKMVFRILAVLAEFERDLISERTKTALRHLKSNGRRTGGVPYGYASESGALVEIPAEQAILARIYAMHAAGVCPQHIADRLNTENVPTKTRRGEWGRSAICRILARP